MVSGSNSQGAHRFRPSLDSGKVPLLWKLNSTFIPQLHYVLSLVLNEMKKLCFLLIELMLEYA